MITVDVAVDVFVTLSVEVGDVSEVVVNSASEEV
jgi:hypothetical protein